MAYISYNKLWESEFDNIVFNKDEVQIINNNQLKLEVPESFKQNEKVTTSFEASNQEDVVSQTYLDEKFFKNRWSHILIRKKLQRFYYT